MKVPKSLFVRHYMWVVFSLVVVLCFYGCGGHENPEAERSQQSPLVSPQTLNNWIENGYSDEAGYTKLVVLDVTTPDKYAAGHIPGAYFIDKDKFCYQERSEGIAPIPAMIPSRSTIEEPLKSVGVDEKTVIALTGDEITYASMAYRILMYWGFPNHRLKVLDGTNKTWKDAGYTLTTEAPPPPQYSNFSVCQFGQNISMRATLQEMKDVVRGVIPGVIIDTRAKDEYDGKPWGRSVVKEETIGETKYKYYAIFEGHIKGALHIEYKELFKNKDKDGNYGFLSSEEIKKIFNEKGIDGSKTIYLYCRTAKRLSPVVLALHTLLGYPVKFYDGSWTEWGMMADRLDSTGTMSGTLKTDSPWRTNLPELSVVVTYNKDNPPPVEPNVIYDVKPFSPANSYTPRSDLINEEDASACGVPAEGPPPGGELPPPGC